MNWLRMRPRRAERATSMNMIRLAAGLVTVLFACGKDSTAPTAPVPATRVAFLVAAGVNTSLAIVNDDGSGRAILASGTWWDIAYSWSPDGARIVFGGGHDSASIGIYVVNADGTGLRRLTSDPEWVGSGVSNVSWSPDGAKIAFLSYSGGIEAMNADGTGRIHVADGGGISWSPDGRRIAYSTGSPDGGWPEIYVSNSDGSGQTRITRGYRGLSDCCGDENTSPTWSPDGRRIAYMHRSNADHDGYTSTALDVRVINADGTGDTSFTRTLPIALNPVWSPVGARLALWSNSSKGPYEIYVMNADGSGLARVTSGASFNGCRHISWAPNGTRVAYCARDAGDLYDSFHDVYTVRIDGTDVRNLTNDAAAEGEPRWNPRR